MKRFLNSVSIALGASDWYGALSTALVLPDICGRIEAPEKGSKERYVDWFNRYMVRSYLFRKDDGDPEVMLSGEDCYALRCSYLHEGGGDITDQRARRALDSFHFIKPPKNGIVHCNKINNVLQLQVDIFCRQICGGVLVWLQDTVAGSEEFQSRQKNLLEIHEPSNNLVISGLL